MKKLLSWIIQTATNVIEAMENSEAPFWYVIFSFVSAVILRNFLEFISNRVEIRGDMILHYFLFYVALALGLLIVLHLLTKEKITKIARLILPCFIVLIVAPITDLLVSRGDGLPMSYLMPEHHGDLLTRYLAFFGKFERFGVTPGIKTEVFLVLIGMVLYFYVKKLSWIKIISGVALVYTTIFCYVSTPYFVEPIYAWLNLPLHYSDILGINLNLILAFFELIILAFLVNKKICWCLLADIRPCRLLHFWMMFFLGIILAYVAKDQPILTENSIIYIPFILVSITFAWVFSVMTNNIADLEIDKISNAERPLIRSEVSLDEYKTMTWLVLAVALSYAAAVNLKVLYLIAFFIGNYFMYSMPPLRIKKVPFLSKLPILLNLAALVILGFIGFNTMNVLDVIKLVKEFGADFDHLLVLSSLFLFCYLLAINFIDIKDYEGDKKERIHTLPVIFGLTWGKIFIGLGFFGSYVAGSLLIGNESLVVIAIAVGLIQFYLVCRKNYHEKFVWAVYIVSLLVVFYEILRT